MHDTVTPEEAAEERRLWADYYEAMARVLEIMRREGTVGGALTRIVEEDTIAGRAIARIMEIRRIAGASRQAPITRAGRKS